jgi:hypothetical protein
MPVRWTFVSRKKLFKVVGEGDISRADVDLVLDAMLENGFLGCRKLVDLRQSELGMTGEEMLEVGVRVRSMHGLGKMGPLAMVLPEDRGTSDRQVRCPGSSDAGLSRFRKGDALARRTETHQEARAAGIASAVCGPVGARSPCPADCASYATAV